MNLSTVKWAHWDKTQSRELLGLFICVCIALCTIVAHNIAQNRSDNFPSYPLENHCSDDVYFREGGNKRNGVLTNTISVLYSSFLPLLSCLTKTIKVEDFNLGLVDVQPRGAIWPVTVSNLLRRQLQVCICNWSTMRKHDVIHKTVSTQRTALSSAEDWFTVTGNMQRKFNKVGHVVLKICHHTEWQWYRHAGHNTLHLSRGQSNKHKIYSAPRLRCCKWIKCAQRLRWGWMFTFPEQLK